jgi:tryptophan-rich sensory protein
MWKSPLLRAFFVRQKLWEVAELIKVMSKKVSVLLGVIVSVLIAQMAGIIGSFFTFSSIQSWYVFLEKPFFAPPNWLFAPAWITLYTLMGIAAFLVWQKRGEPGVKKALWLYGVQLVLNALWSVIFFGLQNPFLAFLLILALWLLIVLVTVKFWEIRKVAGILFVPYIAWVSFAAILNFAIWRLNV